MVKYNYQSTHNPNHNIMKKLDYETAASQLHDLIRECDADTLAALYECAFGIVDTCHNNDKELEVTFNIDIH